MSKEFKLNDRVFHPTQGWGKVANIETDTKYPLKVIFDNGAHVYLTIDGKYSIQDTYPTLSYKEYGRCEGKKKKPIYDRIEVGDKVFCVLYGWGNIKRKDDSGSDSYPIVVVFDNTLSQFYTRDGKFAVDSIQRVLFKSERKVSKPENSKEIK